jgi:hypothetical protein
MLAAYRHHRGLGAQGGFVMSTSVLAPDRRHISPPTVDPRVMAMIDSPPPPPPGGTTPVIDFPIGVHVSTTPVTTVTQPPMSATVPPVSTPIPAPTSVPPASTTPVVTTAPATHAMPIVDATIGPSGAPQTAPLPPMQPQRDSTSNFMKFAPWFLGGMFVTVVGLSIIRR